jgi:hypothetical protein
LVICPKCKKNLIYKTYKTIFRTKNDILICKHCGTNFKIKMPFLNTFINVFIAYQIGLWIYRSHYSIISITTFIIYLILIYLLEPKFSDYEII